MDERTHLILIRGENKTKEIQYCSYNPQTKSYDVTFTGGKTYHYGYNSIAWYKEPKALNPALFQISADGKVFYNIQSIFSFSGPEEYWHIIFENGFEKTYRRSDLAVVTSCLKEAASRDCLEYLRSLAAINELKSEDGEVLLKKQYETLSFVSEKSALAVYLNPEKHPVKVRPCDNVIFPFGGNASQFKAVRSALTNQMSVIQGPPGTGKTQTILNIIANLLLQNRTVEIVSNNNSATENVLEKLASPKYGMGFLVAPLGKRQNKNAFVERQCGSYPDLSLWERTEEAVQKLREKTAVLAQELSNYFEKQERLACARQEITALELEMRYFEQYCEESGLIEPKRAPRKNITAEKVLQMLQECEAFLERQMSVSFWYKAKSTVLYGLFEWNYYRNDISDIVTYLLKLYYRIRHTELKQEIRELEQFLSAVDAKKKMDQLTQDSMEYLRAALFERYGRKNTRKCFSAEALWKAPESILEEYPIVLSTTFSSRSSLKNIMYDYIIMDEASQVDLATGALALSCAENAVIVGDLKQLPNVISEPMKIQSNAIFASYKLPIGYSYSDNSFLKSVCSVIHEIPQTLLREHYRCHPKIIGFCNQKFYKGELVIMTEDHGEKDTLSVYRTVIGDHRRGHVNQRQIDVTMKEVLPAFSDTEPENIGIIAPYRHQVEALAASLENSRIETDTVHKFQGREKDVILLTTVDDEITEFSDDPYLLNVAISRAKKKLCLVTSGNEQPKDSNIQDLISYIEYNNFSVVHSELYSVFDLLYQQYTAQRIAYLEKHKKISKYDSENLMYAALVDLLGSHPEAPLNVIIHQSVRLLLRDFEKLSEEERRYASHPNTHVDFLIYNRISKAAILAIEVDGFHFHKDGCAQAERDKMKAHIFAQYQIPLLRLPTNGSGEIEKVETVLFGEKI